MPVTTNRRMPLSCEPCRERKIRCPRKGSNPKGPCDSCIRRGVHPTDCVFLRDIQPRRHVSWQRDTEEASNSELLVRIRNLEQQLSKQSSEGVASRNNRLAAAEQTALCSPESNAHSSLASLTAVENLDERNSVSGPSRRSGCGRLLKSRSGHERYEPRLSRWSSILDNNSTPTELRTEIEELPDADVPLQADDNAIARLLLVLPPISQCDALVKVYFDVFAPLWHVLHSPSFLQDYSKFQDEPKDVSLPWLALLYAILGIAVMALNEDSNLLQDLGRQRKPQDNLDILTKRYRTAALDCLEADHYLWRHNLHTLQALVTLIYGINHTHGQSWALLGTARNIGTAMGFHIDPDNFDVDVVTAEERRRCWAAVNMLYTIQNTTLGNIDSRYCPSNVQLPLDIDDDQLQESGYPGLSESRGPPEISYLLYKFRLYEICSRICSSLFTPGTTPSYESILALDSEITAQQEEWNSKYLVDSGTSNVPDYHAVHLNILFGYSHQLFLLLHRPVLMQQHVPNFPDRYTWDQTMASRAKCLASSRALLGVHCQLHEVECFRPYQWYNRGLGSFHAFHGAIFIGYLCLAATDLTMSAKFELKNELKASLSVFEAIEATSLSRICSKVVPILQRLAATLDNTIASTMAESTSTNQNIGLAMDSLSSQNSRQYRASVFSVIANQSNHQAPSFLDSLQPQQWLSPSAIMTGNEWESLFTQMQPISSV